MVVLLLPCARFFFFILSVKHTRKERRRHLDLSAELAAASEGARAAAGALGSAHGEPVRALYGDYGCAMASGAGNGSGPLREALARRLGALLGAPTSGAGERHSGRPL